RQRGCGDGAQASGAPVPPEGSRLFRRRRGAGGVFHAAGQVPPADRRRIWCRCVGVDSPCPVPAQRDGCLVVVLGSPCWCWCIQGPGALLQLRGHAYCCPAFQLYKRPTWNCCARYLQM
ncbi:hypothetical protein GGH99_004171, partial [Coemansia sp. RSA 1285]